MNATRYTLLVVAVLLLCIGLFSLNSLSTGTEQTTETDTPVILIVLESTRADHFSCYGYQRNTTPAMCGIAADGIRFTQAFSQGTVTSYGLPPLLTGLPPNVVGFKTPMTMPSNVQTLAEYLNDTYKTIAYTDIPGYLRNSSTDQGYTQIENLDLDTFTASDVLLENTEDPTHLLFYPRGFLHFPYGFSSSQPGDWVTYNSSQALRIFSIIKSRTRAPIPSTDINKTAVIAMYDHALKTVDDEIGDIVATLKEQGTYRESLIVVTSDHGELLGEKNRYSHAGRPVIDLAHVPLIMKLPGNRHAGTVATQPVRTMDIVPTLLDILDIKDSPAGPSKSLLPAITGEHLNITAFTVQNKEIFWTGHKNNHTFGASSAEELCNHEPYTEVDMTRPVRGDRHSTFPKGIKGDIASFLCDVYRWGQTYNITQERRDRDWRIFPYK